MNQFGIRKCWNAFIRWKGWAAAAAFLVRIWKSMVSWPIWRKAFRISFGWLLMMSGVCTAALVWVFANGMENRISACFVYVLSAYCLTALCVKLPGVVRGGKTGLANHPKLRSLLLNRELRFKLSLYLDHVINFAYGTFKIIAGVVIGSAWIGCDGIYNMAQALIQLFQILRRRRAGTLLQQWKSYRFCGVLILLMHLTLTGIVFQMIHWNRAREQGEILVISTAFFAFYKITKSFIRIAGDRKHLRPVDSSVRMLNLTQSIFAIFSLQASMFHTFGTGESWEHLFNIITGCTVCLLIVSVGIYMIRRSNREIKLLQERDHGE